MYLFKILPICVKFEKLCLAPGRLEHPLVSKLGQGQLVLRRDYLGPGANSTNQFLPEFTDMKQKREQKCIIWLWSQFNKPVFTRIYGYETKNGTKMHHLALEQI
jgi:hypothetical protein